MHGKTSRIRRFFSYYKPYRGLFLADMACCVLAAVISLLIPLCIRYITKEVLGGDLPESARPIFTIGAVMVGLVVVQALCTFFYDAKGHAMGAMMESDLRAELFAHYQRLPFRFHDDEKPGGLMSRITNDLLQLTELYHHGPEDLLVYLVKFAGALAILLHTNRRLTLVILCFLPVLTAFVLYFSKLTKRAVKAFMERVSIVNAHIEDNLSGIREVQSFANEGLEIEKFSKENSRFLENRKACYQTESYFYVGVNAFTQLILIAAVVAGGAAITRSAMDLADLLTFVLYIGYLSEPIPQLARIIQQYQQGISGYERFMDIMEQEPEICDGKQASVPENIRGELVFSNVSFRYREGEETVLENLSLQVRAGEHVALVGSSGVGKTTLCSLIPRFYDVAEGSICLDGMDVRDWKLEALRQKIGVVQQEVYLFAGTVRENIRYGKPDAGDEEIVQAAKDANAHDFITALPQGYDTDIGYRGVKLSGGQKQRLGIARVFLKNPPVLILDEATSALDSESERMVQLSLERLSEGRTTFVIAHRLSTIRGADKIIVLSDKGIHEQGTHEELMAEKGSYCRMYQRQFAYR